MHLTSMLEFNWWCFSFLIIHKIMVLLALSGSLDSVRSSNSAQNQAFSFHLDILPILILLIILLNSLGERLFFFL